ncbi:MAG: glutamate-1-semialdehyde 2,1-aminomutase [Acidobacteriota bacterium]
MTPRREALPSKRSKSLMDRARRLMPGGVNSPVRAFTAVGGNPVFIARGRGSHVLDADDNDYIDYLGSWGPLILGHAPPAVVEAVARTARDGTSFGAPTRLEADLAELVIEAIPSIEMVRMVNSGTEATLSALRLARAITRRELVVKFEGCYHGHVDALLVKAGSGVATLAIPGSPGVPAATVRQTLTAPFNDVSAVEGLFAAHAGEIACVIVEPIAGNMGVVPPASGFLQALRRITSDDAALLIFDEVMTGFRVAHGGAQQLYGIEPDLTTLGKIIGGGLPVGAYGGPAQLMRHVAPEGPVYQAGTLSGNPLAMAAGVVTLEALKAPGFYEQLEQLGARLATGLEAAARDAGIDCVVNRVGSMITPFFTQGTVRDYASAAAAAGARYATFFHLMLERGVNLPPSPFEAWFVSAAHTREDIDATIAAACEALTKMSA